MPDGSQIDGIESFELIQTIRIHDPAFFKIVFAAIGKIFKFQLESAVNSTEFLKNFLANRYQFFTHTIAWNSCYSILFQCHTPVILSYILI